MGERLIDANHLLNEIEKLKMSPWFVLGKDPDHKLHGLYLERKEAVEVVEDLCIKKEPTFEEVVNHNSDPAIVLDRQERQHS